MPLVHEANAATLVGRLIGGRYELLELLGVGGTGAVFRAKQVHLQAIRAVKIMLSRHTLDPTLVKRFLREARGLARLDHPNVVHVVDTGETEEGLPFIAMEFLEGESLASTLKRDGPLPWPIVKHIARQVCHALHAAHEVGIVHRDIKPDNCFRIYDGDDGYRIKLLDFGIARFESDDISRITEQGSVIGTIPYMSCEQIAGEVCDRRSDIWSAGVVLYELLCGKRPFRGSNIGALSSAIARDEPPSLVSVRPDLELPPPLDTVLARAMAKNRNDRFQTMAGFLEALEAVPDPIGFVNTEPFTKPQLSEMLAAASSTSQPLPDAENNVAQPHSAPTRASEQIEVSGLRHKPPVHSLRPRPGLAGIFAVSFSLVVLVWLLWIAGR